MKADSKMKKQNYQLWQNIQIKHIKKYQNIHLFFYFDDSNMWKEETKGWVVL